MASSPRKPKDSASDQDSEDFEVDSSFASGSISEDHNESVDSTSFNVRNRSTTSSSASKSALCPDAGDSPPAWGKLCSPLANQHVSPRLYPDLKVVTPSPRSPKSPKSPKSPRGRRPAKTPECDEYHIDQNVVIGVIVGIMVAVGVVMYLWPQTAVLHAGTQTSNPREVVRDAYSLGSQRLVAAFPSQTSNFWATINAAVKSVMDPKNLPLQPAVIMITCTKETCPLADCIASHLATTVTEAYVSESPLDLNVSNDLIHLRADDAKMRIDDEFRSHLQSGSRAVILRNLHDLAGGAAMILHGFCDNENAPFKEAVLIFTLQLPSDSAIKTAIGLTNAIETTLTRSWGKQLDTDNLSALYSRIINSPVYVKPESNELFLKQCVPS